MREKDIKNVAYIILHSLFYSTAVMDFGWGSPPYAVGASWLTNSLMSKMAMQTKAMGK